MSSNATQIAKATAEVQRILSDENAKIQVDGLWGKFTEAAYNDASVLVKWRVSLMLRELGLTIDQLRGARSDLRANEWIPIDKAEEMLATAASKVGMGAFLPALKEFLRREAIQRNGAYKVTSRNGVSSGLMQMQPAAWSDAQRIGKQLNIDLPDFSAGWFKPEDNIMAGVLYARGNARQIQRADHPVNADTLYLAHNQGAGFFPGPGRRQIITAYGRQSKEVQAMIDRYRSADAVIR